MSTTEIAFPANKSTESPSSGNRQDRVPLGTEIDFARFDNLLQSHQDMCIKRASRMLRNSSDVHDAVQSAFRKAFQCRDQFHGDGAFAAWLGRIVENECLMRLRKERTAHFVSLDNPNDSDARLEIVGSATSPEDELGWQEVVEVLHKEMLRMPPIFRNVMLLHDGEQLPIMDVARRLGLSVPAAKSRLSRARRELRFRMGKHCGRKGPGTLLEKAIYKRTAYARGS